MKHEEMVDDFLKRFPEFLKQAEEDKEWWGSENPEDEPLASVFYDDVVSPYLIAELNNQNYSELVQRLFQYLEEITVSEDEIIKETLKTSILESLGDDRIVLSRARDLMGPKTRELSHEAEYDLGRESMPQHYFNKYWSRTDNSNNMNTT